MWICLLLCMCATCDNLAVCDANLQQREQHSNLRWTSHTLKCLCGCIWWKLYLQHNLCCSVRVSMQVINHSGSALLQLQFRECQRGDRTLTLGKKKKNSYFCTKSWSCGFACSSSEGSGEKWGSRASSTQLINFWDLLFCWKKKLLCDKLALSQMWIEVHFLKHFWFMRFFLSWSFVAQVLQFTASIRVRSTFSGT